MHLKEYLSLNSITSKDFAKHLGVSKISISRYINGVRIPRKKILEKIFKLTKGFVTANDFLINFSDEKDDETDEFEIEKIISSLKSGSRKSLAKSITLIESSKISDQKKAEMLVSKLPKNNKTIRIGVSGVPGVGKSTFIESLGLSVIKKGHKVAVLAIDPSSQKTGGSILGDKTRMEELSIKKNAFIRPTPSSGHLGGVAKKTRESISCFEAAGYEIIFVETMGVGQAETAVYNMVDIFIVLLLPSGGDDLQGIKKGIIELSDLLIVNKADNSLIPAANITVNDYRTAISIIRPIRKDWKPEILKCSSLNNEGIEEIWKSITNFIAIRIKNNNLLINRSKQNIYWMWELIENNLNFFIKEKVKNEEIVRKIEQNVYNQNIDPTSAAKQILKTYMKNYN